MAEFPFDWCSFYALFWNDKGIRCKVNIPDTVLFRHGQLSAWWANNKEGCIQRHTSQTTSVEAIRKRFLQVANDDESNYSKFVAVSRLGEAGASPTMSLASQCRHDASCGSHPAIADDGAACSCVWLAQLPTAISYPQPMQH